MSSLQTRQVEGQPNLPFYSYAIAMNLVTLKLSLLNGDTALKYEPILKFKAILESELGLFSEESQLFCIWTTLFFDRCHMAFWLGFSSGLKTRYFLYKKSNCLFYDYNMGYSDSKMVYNSQIGPELRK